MPSNPNRSTNQDSRFREGGVRDRTTSASNTVLSDLNDSTLFQVISTASSGGNETNSLLRDALAESQRRSR